MAGKPTDLAAALADAARAINAPQDLHATLDAIVHAARASVPGFEDVGITVVHRGGKLDTRAATGDLVRELDELQYELGEGPCLDAMREGEVMRVEHLRHEQRWPRYIPRAAAAGLTAQLGIRLYDEQDTLGALNFYTTSSETLAPDAERIAELFATHAAVALGRARRESQLGAAMGSRKVIGQALGIVMERYQVNEERAFHFLVRASSTSNVKLRAVAEELVTQAETKYTLNPPLP